MRSFGKSDILFLIFFADMTVLMLYGMSELLSYTYIHGGMVASSITLKNMFVYFYYPPKNILSLFHSLLVLVSFLHYTCIFSTIITGLPQIIEVKIPLILQLVI